MLLVACSGFPVPVSRYWGAFPAVEISDTEIAMPGRGSIRRWTREAPEGCLVSVLAPQPPAFAPNAAPFDSTKFFAELSARSVSMPQGFDSKKFFDELAAKSVSTGRKFDAKTFFDELQSRGVSVPAGFDAKKFFTDIASTGALMPPMVDMTK